MVGGAELSPSSKIGGISIFSRRVEARRSGATIRLTVRLILAGAVSASATFAVVVLVRRGRVVELVLFLAGASIIFPFIAAVTCFGITSPCAGITLRRKGNLRNGNFVLN